MFCKKCGNQIADNAQFCPKCGTPVANQTPFANQQRPMTQMPVTSAQTGQPEKEYMTANSAQLAQQQKNAKKAPPAEYTMAFPKPKAMPSEEYEQSVPSPNTSNVIYPDATDRVPMMNQQPPVAKPAPTDPPAAKVKKSKKSKGNIGLRIVAIVLAVAVLATGGLFLADFFAHKKQTEGTNYIGLGEFPVLKKNTAFTVIDSETFPVEEYEIKIEHLNGGGLLRSNAFVDSDSPVVKEKSRNPIYNIEFPSNGNYRITLTEIIPAVRTNTLPTETSADTTDVPPSTEIETNTNTNTETIEAKKTKDDDVVIIIIIDVKVDDADPEARDEVTVNSRADEGITTTTTVAVEEPELPPTSGPVQVTEEDFRNFEKMVLDSMSDTIPEFNFRESSVAYITENLITDFTGISGYSYYFGSVDPKNTSKDGFDPLKKWSSYNSNGYAYWVLDEANVKWICENIFHVKYSSNISTEKLYSHEGYVYKYKPQAVSAGYQKITVKSYIQVGSQYKIRVEASLKNNGGLEYYDFMADLQQVEDSKYWTIYEIVAVDPNEEPQDAEKPDIEVTKADLNELSKFLLAINYTEFDSASASTAYVVEKMLTNEFSAFGYGYFYGNTATSQQSSDPLNRFGTSHIVMNSDNVKWACENVFNVRYDSSFSTTSSYVNNGRVYRKSIVKEETENYFSTPTGYQVKNKRYVVESKFWSAPIGHNKMDGTEKLLGTYEIVAELKNVDGQRIWSVYSIKKIG